MYKLIISKHFCGKIYVDMKNELKMGSFDWVMMGPRNAVAEVNGYLTVLPNHVVANMKSARKPVTEGRKERR